MYTAPSILKVPRYDESSFDINIGSPYPTKSDNPYGPYGDKRRGDGNAGPAPNTNACDADTGSDGSGNSRSSAARGLDVPGAIFARYGTVPTLTNVFRTYVPPQSPMSNFGSPHETTSRGRGRSITRFGGPLRRCCS